MVLGDGLRELMLDAIGGREADDDSGTEFVMRFLLFGSADVDLASQAMTVCVQAGFHFPGFGGGPT
jgi:hypothetical protein